MKVKDAMAKTPAFCSPETNLAETVAILWNHNCGILPVVDPERRVVGVITDRDIAIAAGTRNQPPGDIRAVDAATCKVHTCKPEDDIHIALDTMAENKVRRLVVVNEQNQLQGILSMDDVVLYAETKTSGKTDLSSDDVLRTLKTLYGPQLMARRATVAA